MLILHLSLGPSTLPQGTEIFLDEQVIEVISEFT